MILGECKSMALLVALKEALIETGTIAYKNWKQNYNGN